MKKNKQKKCAIVMYHYVRDTEKTNYPKIKALSIGKFKNQLDYLQKNYKIISLPDYICYLNGKKDISENSCILTFDDGFSDHYKNVFPILKKKKISACFFPITCPLTESKIPVVHQTHFLLAKIGSEKLAKEFNKLLVEKFPKIAKKFIADNKVLKQKKCVWDKSDILAGNLKYNISLMPGKAGSEIVNSIFNRYFKNKEKFCKELYMNFSQMREMQRAGMFFGNHGHYHLKLTRISKKEQKEEIIKSKKILEKELGEKVVFFSYPYGAYDKETIKIIKNEGYSCALTTDFAINKGKDINMFALKRLDTNHILLK